LKTLLVTIAACITLFSPSENWANSDVRMLIIFTLFISAYVINKLDNIQNDIAEIKNREVK
jgi:hypothetical protein